jgi:hypothetical protein
MFPRHFRWDPAMELVKESPPPLIPAEAGNQFCPGCLKYLGPRFRGDERVGRSFDNFLTGSVAGTGHAIKRGLCGVPDITRTAANGSIFIRSDGTAGAFGDLCGPGGHLAFPRPSGEDLGPPRQGLPFSYTACPASPGHDRIGVGASIHNTDCRDYRHHGRPIGRGAMICSCSRRGSAS